jgi:hypothetical protein
MNLFYQLTKIAEYEAGENWNARREICPIQNFPLQILHGQLFDCKEIYVLRSVSYDAFSTVFYWNMLHFYCWKCIIEQIDLSVYQNFGIVSFWKSLLTFWELLTVFTKEMYKNVNREIYASITNTNWRIVCVCVCGNKRDVL